MPDNSYFFRKALSRSFILVLPVYYYMITLTSPFEVTLFFPLIFLLLFVILNMYLIRKTANDFPEYAGVIVKAENHFIWGMFSAIAIILSLVALFNVPDMGSPKGGDWERVQWLGPFAFIVYPLVAASNFIDWLLNPVLLLYILIPIIIIFLIIISSVRFSMYQRVNQVLIDEFIYNDGYAKRYIVGWNIVLSIFLGVILAFYFRVMQTNSI